MIQYTISSINIYLDRSVSIKIYCRGVVSQLYIPGKGWPEEEIVENIVIFYDCRNKDGKLPRIFGILQYVSLSDTERAH